MACLGRTDDLVYDQLGLPVVSLEKVLRAFPDRLVDDTPHFGVTQLGLCLSFELGFRRLYRDDGGEPVPEVVTAYVDLNPVEQARPFGIRLQCSSQRPPEPRDVGTSLVGVNVVDVGDQVLGKRRVIA